MLEVLKKVISLFFFLQFVLILKILGSFLKDYCFINSICAKSTTLELFKKQQSLQKQPNYKKVVILIKKDYYFL
jgi:hypothetical protein